MYLKIWFGVNLCKFAHNLLICRSFCQAGTVAILYEVPQDGINSPPGATERPPDEAHRTCKLTTLSMISAKRRDVEHQIKGGRTLGYWLSKSALIKAAKVDQPWRQNCLTKYRAIEDLLPANLKGVSIFS